MPSIPSKFPVSVKTGAVVVKIYKVRTGPNGEYTAFNVTFNEGGRRVHRKFSDWPDAKNEAQRIAVSLANRDTEAAQVTYRDAQILAHCRMLLEPFGMTLESAVERFCKAAKAIGPDRVVEAAVSQARAHPVSAPEQIAIADACDIYHGHLVAQGRSERHLMDVKSRLGRFLTDHRGMNLDDITPAGLQRWIDNLRTVEGKPAAPITRRNSAAVVSAMLSFHRRRGRLAVSPANDLEKPSPRSNKRAEKWTPEEARRILDNIAPDARPAFAVCLFAGTRTSEADRATRADFNTESGFLTVWGQKGRLKSRRLVPIAPNLMEWLRDWLQSPPETNLWPYDIRVLFKRVTKACARAKVHRIGNGARDSRISYRLAQTGDDARVAHESGHGKSAKMIHDHYNDLATPADAEKYFDIRPA